MYVNEIFYSPEGEGKLTGIPMVHIRLTGCNLRCIWCDTKYAFSTGAMMSIDEIISKVREYKTNWVSITGGEPLMQKDFWALSNRLFKLGYKIKVETNGTIDVSGKSERVLNQMFWSISPKLSSSKTKLVIDALKVFRDKVGRVHKQWKFVIDTTADYEEVENLVNKLGIKGDDIIMQPCASDNLDLYEYAKKVRWLALKILSKGDNHLTIILQQHKIMFPGFERDHL